MVGSGWSRWRVPRSKPDPSIQTRQTLSAISTSSSRFRRGLGEHHGDRLARRLPGGVGYVAVRTPMSGVAAEMIDWWFDWHPRDPQRYRIWYPAAHSQPPSSPQLSATSNRSGEPSITPVEDLGSETRRSGSASGDRLTSASDPTR